MSERKAVKFLVKTFTIAAFNFFIAVIVLVVGLVLWSRYYYILLQMPGSPTVHLTLFLMIVAMLGFAGGAKVSSRLLCRGNFSFSSFLFGVLLGLGLFGFLCLIMVMSTWPPWNGKNGSIVAFAGVLETVVGVPVYAWQAHLERRKA